MRKAVFLLVILLGIGVGFLAAFDEGWGVRIVLMIIGAAVGAVFGAAVSQIGRRIRRDLTPILSEEELRPIPGGLGLKGRDVLANYWRDEGHLPHMKPPKPELGDRMFDADKWN